MSPEDMTVNPTFSVTIFLPRLRSITAAALEDLRYREPSRKEKNSPTWLPFMWLQAAYNSFETLAFVCANDTQDPQRRLEYVLSMPALARVVLEALFNTILLLDDLPSNVRWFHRSHWRETVEQRYKLLQRHAKDSNWTEMIAGLERVRDAIADQCALRRGDLVSHKTLVPKYWPAPSKMSEVARALDRKRLLDFLDDRFYGELSAAAHLKGSGLTFSIVPFVMDESDERRSEGIELLRAKYFIFTATFLTAILSELEIAFGIGIASDLRKVWDLLPTWRPEEAGELYEQHYRSRLAS